MTAAATVAVVRTAPSSSSCAAFPPPAAGNKVPEVISQGHVSALAERPPQSNHRSRADVPGAVWSSGSDAAAVATLPPAASWSGSAPLASAPSLLSSTITVSLTPDEKKEKKTELFITIDADKTRSVRVLCVFGRVGSIADERTFRGRPVAALPQVAGALPLPLLRQDVHMQVSACR